ncbi:MULTISPECIES: DUF1801 domain-containing protein [unclassified Cytobacillus]|uniref:DUF1801 domain-containing protein n=1 Tax=unclassified Cytobacillus TaxID=2675268 RepID=UPI0013590211|nr:DUF1801 domain-containing protein [Cytobacillus sp. AMY 15.2]KAF0818194.1 hypothetical protein KIS4809_2996 [Bacillus sp. ZZV12-4809]MCM3093606.1 DUF1801 domain-containing protein [Cytobacillus sp. AMY 15.2]
MSEPKMKETNKSVIEFIESVENEKKKADAYQLLEIFEEVTGYEAKMWGPSIIGFGKYHYKYASGREGDAPLAGFSPRKAKISLYLSYESEEREKLLEGFGKYTKSKACIYVNKLADINTDVLKDLIKLTVETYQELYPTE